jgi:ParB family chromosome partitioning protein
MNFQDKIVPLCEIDLRNDTYRISTDDDPQEILPSIEAVGLIDPPILIQNQVDYTIICGFRRINAYRVLERATCRARILPSNSGLQELATIAIADNALRRPLNLIEQARAIRLIFDVAKDTRQRVRLASQAGLGESMAIMQKTVRLLELPHIVQKAVMREAISLSMASELGRLAPDEAGLLAKVFSDLKLGLNKQREILTLASEISRREEILLVDLWQSPPIQTIMANSDWDRNQKTRWLRSHLRQRRFPEISCVEERFLDCRKRLNLGPGVTLTAPKNFEDTTYTIRLAFRNIIELKGQVATLTRIGDDPNLATILARD